MMTIVNVLKKSLQHNKLWLLTILFHGATVSSFSNTPDTINIQFKWTHQFQFAGFYAASEKGYYKDEGLHVNFIEGKVNTNFIDQVIQKKAQFGVESPKLLLDRNKGKSVVVLASIFQHSPEAFITLSKYRVTSVDEFKNKRIRMSANILASTTATLIKEKIKDKVQLVSSGNRLTGLLNGDYEIIDGYITDLPFSISQLGYHPITISPLAYGIDFYGDCIFTTEEYIKNEPLIVESFLRASLKGWQYAMNNKQEITDLILEKYNTELTEEELMHEARKMEELILPNFVEIGHTSKSRWKHIGDTYVGLGMLKKDYSLDGFIYSDYEIKRQASQKKLQFILFISIGVLLILTSLIFFFNRRLKKAVRKQTKELRISNLSLINEINERKEIHSNLVSTTHELKENQKVLNEKNETLIVWNKRIQHINAELKQAKRKAEESDKLKSAFLSNMSHEIRTPMNGIIGFSDLLKDKNISLDEKEKYTNIIEQNSLQLLRIISDIIDISKIEVGQLSIKKEMVSIQEIFEGLFQIFKLKTDTINGGAIQLKFYIGENIPEKILTDPTRLKQILSNLIENAIKFTSEGTIIFSIELNKEKTKYHFSVKDTGKGISAEKVEKVFERFFKDSDQHFADMGGTGLGLSIAKNLIELLEGRIWLTSEQEKGSQFYFSHPL